METEIEHFLQACRMQHRHHHIDQMEVGLMRRRRAFGGVIVAHQRQNAAKGRCPGEIGVTEHVAATVDPRPLAVPDRKYPIIPAFAAHLRLLRAPYGGGGQILVQTGRETNVVFIEQFPGADHLMIDAAERRTAIAGDKAGGVQPGSTVALLLHQQKPHQRLYAGYENNRLLKIVFVVEADRFQRRANISDRTNSVLPHGFLPRIEPGANRLCYYLVVANVTRQCALEKS